MSQVLYEADNLSIKGHHYTVKTYWHNPNQSGSEIPSGFPHSTDTEWSEIISDAIHLDFTLLINGKLKTFGWSFIIEKDNENWFEYSLTQWSDWNAIYLLLSQIGYKIWDSENTFWQWIVREWIGKIMS